MRNDDGHVRIDVCTRETFLKTECPYAGEAASVTGVTVVRIEGVPPGVYALQVYHDPKDHHDVDRSKVLGVPLVGIGFSNDARIGLRGPSFSKAAFQHGQAEQTLSVKLRHYN